MSEEIKLLHIPVLLEEVLQITSPKPGESYLDLTAGAGGHAAAILDLTRAPEKTVLVDRDEQAIAILTKKFKKSRIIRQDFLSACRDLHEAGETYDIILADLGLSSMHLDTPTRGFSIKNPGPLDMRMDQLGKLDAYEIINTWSENQLVKILIDYGEEPKARTIARKIMTSRPIKTTDQLAAIVASSASWRMRGKSKIHPATKTFQAIRIAVNGELEQIEKSLPMMLKLLAPSGRLAIISFHSLEDRIVKNFLAEHSAGYYDQEFKLLIKKPITASPDELVSNPRARSAKLRAVAKIKNKPTKFQRNLGG